MTKAEIETIQNIIYRLKQPRCGASVGTMEFDYEKAKLYVNTWLAGPLELLLPGEGRDPNLAARMSRK